MSSTPDVIFLTEEGWWAKSHQGESGWWWRRIDAPGTTPRRYSELPPIVETYQPSSMIHELARTAE